MSFVTPIPPSVGDLITNARWVQDVVDNMIAMTPAGIPFFIDGGGGVLTTGIKGTIEVPFKCDINSVRLLADQSGSVVVDIWKDTYANYPPTVADTITASDKPTLSAAQKNQNNNASTWTQAFSKGDIILPNVDSVTTVEQVVVFLRVAIL